MTNETVNKTVVEIDKATHQRLKAIARENGMSVKAMASIALDYSLLKIESGELSLVEPALKEGGAQ